MLRDSVQVIHFIHQEYIPEEGSEAAKDAKSTLVVVSLIVEIQGDETRYVRLYNDSNDVFLVKKLLAALIVCSCRCHCRYRST